MTEVEGLNEVWLDRHDLISRKELKIRYFETYLVANDGNVYYFFVILVFH